MRWSADRAGRGVGEGQLEEERTDLVDGGDLHVAVIDEGLHQRDGRDVPWRGEHERAAGSIGEDRLGCAADTLTAETKLMTVELETKGEFAVVDLLQVGTIERLRDGELQRLAGGFPERLTD